MGDNSKPEIGIIVKANGKQKILPPTANRQDINDALAELTGRTKEKLKSLKTKLETIYTQVKTDKLTKDQFVKEAIRLLR